MVTRTDPEQAEAAPPRYADLQPGDPAPYFRQRSMANPNYTLDTAAGRYLVLLFHGSAADAHSRAALAAVAERRDLFDDVRASFFGVTADPADLAESRIAESVGVRHFLDFDGSVSRLYRMLPQGVSGERLRMRRCWMVLDPTMRIDSVFPLRDDRSDIAALLAHLEALPPPGLFAGFEVPPPVLILPRIFEPDLCRVLIELYEASGGEPSGFVREVDGQTVLATDPAHKRRRDHVVTDAGLIAAVQARVHRRIVPEIARVHQFNVTRMERNLVACYSAEERGHFAPHRDNTTKGTAHRRFAVSINLNSDFDGGEIWFPEYGRRGYKPPPGGACVFSCSMLHAASPVTRGKRYAFLPFLYDEAAAKVREANNAYLGEGLSAYKA